jgi:hypothetical protein
MRLFRRRDGCNRPGNSVRRADLGDIVRIVDTPETTPTGYANRTGTCYGFTTPSITGVEVIGGGATDDALNVGFDDGTTAWFDPSLVIFLDVNAGQVAIVGDKRFVRAPSGEWVEEPDSKMTHDRRGDCSQQCSVT